jgi:hypothetical protein
MKNNQLQIQINKGSFVLGRFELMEEEVLDLSKWFRTFLSLDQEDKKKKSPQ